MTITPATITDPDGPIARIAAAMAIVAEEAPKVGGIVVRWSRTPDYVTEAAWSITTLAPIDSTANCPPLGKVFLPVGTDGAICGSPSSEAIDRAILMIRVAEGKRAAEILAGK